MAALVVPPAPAVAAAPSTPWTWGGNGFGQLGDGTTTDRRTPGPAAVADVIDTHGGREHVLALRSDGTAWVWGSNVEGQLGLGTTANVSTPTQVPNLTGVVAVETGHNHSLALLANGTVRSWGLNSDGQVGDGTTSLRRSPVTVSGLTDAVAIAAGRNMSYAIRANGTLVAWGRNAEGQLGDGTVTRRLTPVRVGSLTGVVGVAGGRDHGLALLAGGAVWAWGANAYGQVGDGTIANRSTPVQVMTGASQVIAGAHHSYALRTDGQVAAWGRNYRANLGDGTTTTRRLPVLVRNVSSAVSIGSGRDHGLAVLADGTVRAWGYNAGGQLGDGTTTNRSTAVTVPGISDALEAGGGGQLYSLVLVDGGGPPPNQPPEASLSISCALLTCTADASASRDPDGSVVAFDWTLGDGSTGSTPTITHDYAQPGTYDVQVTVTDDEGAHDTATVSVSVTDQPPPDLAVFRAAAAADANASVARVSVPPSVAEGDRLVLILTVNRAATVTAPPGWTELGSVSDGLDVRSWLFTRPAATATAGSVVSIPLDAISKASLTLVAYDAGEVSDFASAAESATTATHLAPASSVSTAGSIVLRYWADKTSTVHGWTVPDGLTARATTTGSSGGMLTSLTADSEGWLVGPVPSQAGTAGTSSSKAVSWTVVLPPG